MHIYKKLQSLEYDISIIVLFKPLSIDDMSMIVDQNFNAIT